MFDSRRSTNFLMAKKNSVSPFVKIIFATIIWRLRKLWFSQHTQMQPEVATSCFVPDKCGVAWGVRLTADSLAAWSGISAFRDRPILFSSQWSLMWRSQVLSFDISNSSTTIRLTDNAEFYSSRANNLTHSWIFRTSSPLPLKTKPLALAVKFSYTLKIIESDLLSGCTKLP